MKQFEFKMPTKVQYGAGITTNLGKIIKGMGYNRIFIVTGSTISKSDIMTKAKAGLEIEGLEYIIYDQLNAEPSVKQVDEASKALKTSKAEAVVAIGGGSRIDAAKAICVLQTHEGSIADYLFGGTKTVTKTIMPLICMPTTAGSGSETTGVSVINDEQRGVKVSITHEYLFPKLAMIDPELHVNMSKFVTGTTGMDALTHAIESYVSLNSEPISDAMGIRAIKMIGENLSKVIQNGGDVEARGNMAIASTIAGAAFVNGGLGVVHGIAQSMGAITDISHGAANALILPYAMKKNIIGNLKKFKDIAIALGEEVSGLSDEEAAHKSVKAVFKLAEDAEIPMKLAEVGITREMFPEIIRGTMGYRLLAINPRKLNEEDVEEILNDAYK